MTKKYHKHRALPHRVRARKKRQHTSSIQRNNIIHSSTLTSVQVVQPVLPEPTTGAEKYFKKSIVIPIVVIGMFMATLDSSIVTVALPDIATYFHLPLNGELAWIVIAYLVATTALLLLAGRLMDTLGGKTICLVGLLLFTIGSACCGLAPTAWSLIVARGIQGIGAACIFAVSPAFLVRAFPPSQRGRALSINAVTVALGVSVGPILGGFLLTILSWRWIFLVNLPLGLLGLVLAAWFLKEPFSRRMARFDLAGAILLLLGLGGLTAGISSGQVIVIVLSMVLLVLFLLVERRVSMPLLPLSLLAQRTFTSSLLSLFFGFMAFFTVSFIMPFYLQQLHQFPPAQAGLLLTAYSLSLAILAPAGGLLADRFPRSLIAAAGLALAGIGMVCLYQLHASSAPIEIIWRLALIGAGQALFLAPNNSMIMSAAPREQQGSASGLLASARTLGQCLGTSSAGALFAAIAGTQMTQNMQVSALLKIQGESLIQRYTYACIATFSMCAVLAAISLLCSLLAGTFHWQVIRPSRQYKRQEFAAIFQYILGQRPILASQASTSLNSPEM